MMIDIYSDLNGVFSVTPVHSTKSGSVNTSGGLMKPVQTLHWNEDILDDFRGLLNTGIYDFEWLTTWNMYDNVPRAAELLQLPGTYHAQNTPTVRSVGKREWTKWKSDYIISKQAVSPKPFIWIDDTAPYFWDNHVLGNCRAPGLIIQTNGREGLKKDHIVKIIDWSRNILSK